MKSLASLLGELLVLVIFANFILMGIYIAAILMTAIVELVR